MSTLLYIRIRFLLRWIYGDTAQQPSRQPDLRSLVTLQAHGDTIPRPIKLFLFAVIVLQ